MATNNLSLSGILPRVRELRRDLHAHPELAYQELRTARQVLAFLGDMGSAKVQTGVGGTGIVVTLAPDRPGPCVALRADMDALPIEEAGTQLWRSTVPGVMHACGHDGHTAMLAGAALLLADAADELQGPVKLIFQPAEEGGAGALRMREAGALEDPPVAAIFGLHNNLPDQAFPLGRIGCRTGAAMAGTGTFDIEVIGKGGHAAFPHCCVDPVYIGSCIVDQLQGIVARSIDPLASGVVSVTRFTAGTAYNIIPERALLQGTFRALDAKVLAHLRERIIQTATAIAHAHGATARIRCELGYPVLVNDPRAAACFRAVLAETGEADRAVEVAPIMGGEDFAYFAEQVPAFFYFLGACPPGRDSIPMCHHPDYDFNDDLLELGIRLHVETARRFARLWTR